MYATARKRNSANFVFTEFSEVRRSSRKTCHWADATRPLAFDAARCYRARNVVEWSVGWLKQKRAVATRYEKRALNYRALVVIAALMRWLSTAH